MSSIYSRKSWPYKNIVISSFFFLKKKEFIKCLQDDEVLVRIEEVGWSEERRPHSDRLSLSVPAAATAASFG